jgi:tyrosinase
MKGDLISVEQAPGFQISVLWVPVKPAESASEFPQMVGDYQVLVAATDGLPGGFWKGDTVPSGY